MGVGGGESDGLNGLDGFMAWVGGHYLGVMLHLGTGAFIDWLD